MILIKKKCVCELFLPLSIVLMLVILSYYLEFEMSKKTNVSYSSVKFVVYLRFVC